MVSVDTSVGISGIWTVNLSGGRRTSFVRYINHKVSIKLNAQCINILKSLVLTPRLTHKSVYQKVDLKLTLISLMPPWSSTRMSRLTNSSLPRRRISSAHDVRVLTYDDWRLMWSICSSAVHCDVTSPSHPDSRLDSLCLLTSFDGDTESLDLIETSPKLWGPNKIMSEAAELQHYFEASL